MFTNIKKIDTYLRLNKPEIWSMRLHIVWPIIGLFAILFTLIGFIENPINYIHNDFPFALSLGYLLIVTGLVFWLAFVFRFNIWKSYGMVKKGSGIIHFFLIWFTFFCAVASPMCLHFGRYLRVNAMFSNKELTDDINNLNQLQTNLDLRLIGSSITVSNYRNNAENNDFGYDDKVKELAENFNLKEIPKSGYKILDEDSVVFYSDYIEVFSFSNYIKANFDQSTPKKYSQGLKSGRLIFNKLQNNGRPWAKPSLEPALRSQNPWNKPNNEVENLFALCEKYTSRTLLTNQDIYYWNMDPLFTDYRDEIYNSENAAVSSVTPAIEIDYSKWTIPQIDSFLNRVFFYKTELYLDQSNYTTHKSFEYNNSINSAISSSNESLNKIADYKYWFYLNVHSIFLRIWFYLALGLTLVYFVFRHVTLKTFGITILSGVLLSAVFGLIIGLYSLISYSSGFNNSENFALILLLIYILIFFMLSVKILQSSKRSIFHGIGLSLFFIAFPMLPFILSKIIFDLKFEYLNYQFLRDYGLLILEISSVVLFILSIEPIHRLYLKWYALPEE